VGQKKRERRNTFDLKINQGGGVSREQGKNGEVEGVKDSHEKIAKKGLGIIKELAYQRKKDEEIQGSSFHSSSCEQSQAPERQNWTLGVHKNQEPNRGPQISLQGETPEAKEVRLSNPKRKEKGEECRSEGNKHLHILKRGRKPRKLRTRRGR